jgi:hypothetical protein
MSAAIIQPMVTGGTEVIIGMVQEPAFGPLVVLGFGTVATVMLATGQPGSSSSPPPTPPGYSTARKKLTRTSETSDPLHSHAR